MVKKFFKNFQNIKHILMGSMFFIILCGFAAPAYCSDIPKPIADFLKAKYPKITIRFDGLVEMPDGTQYLPVFPLDLLDIPNPASIVMTIPANVDITAKPDLILFADNFAFFKIIREPGEPPTLLSSSKIPLVIKMGILPQDLIVPQGLELPPELRVLLGDLKIPIKGEREIENILSENPKKQGKKSLISQSAGILTPELKDFIDKTFYVSNFQSNMVYIIPAITGKAIKTIGLSSIPYDKALSNDGRYILISCMSSNKVAIIDTYFKSFIKEIAVGQFPTEIVISNELNQAFVLNKNSSSISVIDLGDMKIINEIKTMDNPVHLTISDDNRTLFYNDDISGKVYSVSVPQLPQKINNDNSEEQTANLVFQANNIAKISQCINNLFILNRAENSLLVYNLAGKKLIKTIEVGSKPVDMKIFPDKNKLYVLSAGDNLIDIIDLTTFEITNKITLKTGGFPKSINILPMTDKVVISSIDSYKMPVIDLNQEKVISNIIVTIPIGSLTIAQPQKN